MAKPNFKALAIDHGEKIVFGLFGVIVLAVLASTSWSRYDKTPDELKRNVKNARDKISSPENSIWPKSEEETYKIVDYSEKSRLLFMPLASIAAGRFDYSTPLYHPLYQKDEPRREPLFEPVTFLHTIPGLAELSISPMTPVGELAADESKPKPEEEMAAAKGSDEFPERPTGPASTLTGRAAQGAAPGTLGSLMAGGAHGAAKSPATAHGAKSGSGHSAKGPGIFDGMPGGEAPGMGTLGSMGALGGEVKARGVPFIAVRGVFPLAKQIENYKRALHVSYSEAANLIEIADFILERQTATSDRQDPWKDAKWTRVSLTRAEEILDECTDSDPSDPVPTAVQDPVITMPLPLRLRFAWGAAATHPKIKDWELNADEIAVENKLIDSLAQVASEGAIQEPEKERRRGLAPKQRDVKGLAKSAAGSADAMSMMKAMASKMGMPAGMPSGAHGASGTARPAPAGGHGASGMPSQMAMQKQMSTMGGAHGAAAASMMGMMGMGGPGAMRPGNTSIDRLVVASQYLLFRYLDFDVEPGLAYRYRVRLQLRNPNVDLTPEELGSAEPEIAKGDERDTPWSNISNPEFVPSIVNFYLKQVDREPYSEEKVRPNGSKSVAQLSMFDWPEKLGTVVNDIVNLWSIGAFIGDEKISDGKKRETVKLDLAQGILEKDKDYKFSTMNVLLDVESDVEVEASHHPDLKLTGADKRGMARLGLVPEALIAMESGEIETLDPYTEREKESKWIRQRDAERKDFDFETKKSSDGNNRLAMMVGQNPENGDEKSDGKKKKGRNSRLKPAQGNGESTNPAEEMMRQMMRNANPNAPTTPSKGARAKQAAPRVNPD